jgi:hypothetical protein
VRRGEKEKKKERKNLSYFPCPKYRFESVLDKRTTGNKR